jgi:hypothetical protein
MIILYLSRANPITLREHAEVSANLSFDASIQTVGSDEPDVGRRCHRPTKLWFTNIMALRAKQEGRILRNHRRDKVAIDIAADSKREFSFLKPNLMAGWPACP